MKKYFELLQNQKYIDGEEYTSNRFEIEILSKKIKIFFDKNLINMLL